MTEFEALAVSIAIEAPMAYVLVRFANWPCRGPLHVSAAAALATAATHPQLWAAALALYPRLGHWPTLLVTETLVVVAEAVVIAWAGSLTIRRALAVSLVANGASLAFGLWFNG